MLCFLTGNRTYHLFSSKIKNSTCQWKEQLCFCLINQYLRSGLLSRAKPSCGADAPFIKVHFSNMLHQVKASADTKKEQTTFFIWLTCTKMYYNIDKTAILEKLNFFQKTLALFKIVCYYKRVKGTDKNISFKNLLFLQMIKSFLQHSNYFFLHQITI